MAKKRCLTAREILWHAMTENEFQDEVIELADTFGWLRYHTRDSRRNEPGFYDWVFLHPLGYGLLLVELKTMKGRVSKEQKLWLDAAQANHAECYVWRPCDLDFIEQRFSKVARVVKIG